MGKKILILYLGIVLLFSIPFAYSAKTLLSETMSTSVVNNSIIGVSVIFGFSQLVMTNCTEDWSGGGASGTFGYGNFTYCSQSGCNPYLLVGTGGIGPSQPDITPNGASYANSSFNCSGTFCVDHDRYREDSINRQGHFVIMCRQRDQTPTYFQSVIIRFRAGNITFTNPVGLNKSQYENLTMNLTINLSDTIMFSSNITGVWVNDSWIDITGNNSFNASTSKNISLAAGQSFGWKYYGNDSYSGITESVVFNSTVIESVLPSVVQLSPANNSLNSSGLINFNCSASDNVALKNISLWGNFTGSWKLNATCNASGISFNCNWNLTLPSNNYDWGCSAADTSGNVNFTRNNWTIIVNDSTLPLVLLISPSNGTNSTISNYTFLANASDNTWLINATFYWNYSGTWLPNGTVTVSGSSAQANFTRANLSVNTYEWNVLFCDISGNCNFSEKNFTLIVRGLIKYCSGNYTENSDWVISSNLSCSNETIPVAGNITILNNASLYLYNVTINFSMFDNGSSFIDKSPNGGLFIYDLDNNPATEEDGSWILSNDSSLFFDFFVYGNGLYDNFSIRNSKISNAGFYTKNKGIKILNSSNLMISGNYFYQSDLKMSGHSIYNSIERNSFEIAGVFAGAETAVTGDIFESGFEDNSSISNWFKGGIIRLNLSSGSLVPNGTYILNDTHSASGAPVDTYFNFSSKVMNDSMNYSVLTASFKLFPGSNFYYGFGSTEVATNGYPLEGFCYEFTCDADGNFYFYDGTAVINLGVSGCANKWWQIFFQVNISNSSASVGDCSININGTARWHRDCKTSNTKYCNNVTSFFLYHPSTASTYIDDLEIFIGNVSLPKEYFLSIPSINISNNSISNSSLDGIFLNFSGDSSLQNNNISFSNSSAIRIFNSSNVSVIGGYLESNPSAFNVSYSANVTISNVSIVKSIFADLDAYSSSIFFINNTFNRSKVYLNGSNFTIKWYIEVQTNPSGALVNVTNLNLSSREYSEISTTGLLLVLESNESTGKFLYGYNITATKENFGDASIELFINKTQVISLTLTGFADVCSYSGSGSWTIPCPNYCNLSSSTDLMGNEILFNGSGTILINGTIFNFSKVTILNACKVQIENGGTLNE